MADALAAAPRWRRQPYRLFFSLGMLLAWAGVLHWLLHSLGVLADYRPIFHAMAQIQGFVTCFAVGFLFTALPRRTGTAAPSAWQMVLATAMPVGTTVAAWYQRWAVAQTCWLTLLFVLAIFAWPRISRGTRRPPDSFLWIPAALLCGIVGSLMTGALALGDEYRAWHDIGQRLALQGTFLSLVLGAGGMVLPLMTRGESVPDAADTPRSRRARLGHGVCAVLLASSFWIEVELSLRGAYFMRAAIVLAVLLAAAKLWKPPSVPGWHRRLIWLSGWMLPLGYLLAGAFAEHRKAGLHVVFIAGFALMVFSVGLHVILAHGGYRDRVDGKPWQVPLIGGLILVAAGARVLVDFDQTRFFSWIGVSAAAFLLASLFWGWLVLPGLRAR